MRAGRFKQGWGYSYFLNQSEVKPEPSVCIIHYFCFEFWFVDRVVFVFSVITLVLVYRLQLKTAVSEFISSLAPFRDWPILLQVTMNSKHAQNVTTMRQQWRNARIQLHVLRTRITWLVHLICTRLSLTWRHVTAGTGQALMLSWQDTAWRLIFSNLAREVTKTNSPSPP